jgi:hypothetical protein
MLGFFGEPSCPRRARSRYVGEPVAAVDVCLAAVEGPATGSSCRCRFASGLALVRATVELGRFAPERVRVTMTSTTGVNLFVGEGVALVVRRGVVDMAS